MRGLLRQGLVLSGIVVAAYANAMSGSFHYDDIHSLVDNTSLRPPIDWGRLLTDPTAFSVDADKAMYRPVVLLSYALQGVVHGRGVTGYLVGNLVLHLACVLLFWRIAARLPVLAGPDRLRRSSRGWADVPLLAAALFALHPVASEPVNYVSSRSETLAALGLLLALWAHLRAGAERRFLGISLPATAVALLSKATAAAVPLLVALRTLTAAPWAGVRDASSRLLRQAGPYALILAGHVALLSALGLLPTDRPEPVRSGWAQAATQLKAVPYYLHTIGMPVHLSVDPAFSEGHWGSVAVAGGAALLLSVAAVIAWAGPSWRWWLCWPLLVALPASAVPLNVLVNEHRIYLATAGVCVPLAALLVRALPRAWMAAVLVGVLALLTVQRNGEWESEGSLWRVAVDRAPASARARVHLGNALRAAGEPDAARRQFAHAVRLEPGNLAARTNLANLAYERAVAQPLRAAEDLAEAQAQYEQVLAVAPDHREALTNLGNVRRLAGDTSMATKLYRQAIERHPRHPDAYANLADLHLEAGDAAGAVPWLEGLVALEPGVSAGHRRLGDARALTGDLEGAAQAYARACDLDPADAGACYNGAEVLRVRGEALLSAGDTAGARRLWQQALRGYRHVLATGGDFRQARQRAAAVEARLRSPGP